MAKVERTFRDPMRLAGDRSLAYQYNAKKNQHIVVEYLPAGEDIWPNVWRFETVDEARNCWKGLQQRYIAKGYVYNK